MGQRVQMLRNILIAKQVLAKKEIIIPIAATSFALLLCLLQAEMIFSATNTASNSQGMTQILQHAKGMISPNLLNIFYGSMPISILFLRI